MFFKVIAFCLYFFGALFANVGGKLMLQPMNEEMLESVGLGPKFTGFIVTSVDDTSAVTKELRQGDVIIAVDDNFNYGLEELITNIQAARIDKIKLTVWRNQQEIPVFIYPIKNKLDRDILGGAQFVDSDQGVIVTVPGQTGLFEKGDVILEINGIKIKYEEEIASLAASDPNSLRVEINRKGTKVSQSLQVDAYGNSSFSQRFSFG